MVFLNLWQPMGIDFRVYWESAWLVVHGLNPYLGIISSKFPFNYPPPALLFILPLGFFRMTQAAPLWNFGSVAAFILAIWLILRMSKTKVSLLGFIFLTAAFTIFYFPEKFNLGNGQINNYIFLLTVLGISWSPLFLAAAISIKLAPAIFLLYFLILRDRQKILITILFVLVLFVLPIVIWGWDFQKRYYQEIFFYSFTLGAKDWYYNQSLFGFLARTFSNPVLINGLFYSLSIVFVVLTWWRGRRLPKNRALAAVGCLYLLIHPVALQHYFMFAVLPFILLIKSDKKILIISYLLLAANIKEPNLVPKMFNFILSHQFYGIFILWLLALFDRKIWKILQLLWVSVIGFAYVLFIYSSRIGHF